MVEAEKKDTQTPEEDKVEEQPISNEEVLELSAQLYKNKNDPEKALSLLKLLDRKKITAQHLIEAKIGKSLTAVNDGPDPERPTADTPELLAKVTQMKEHLKRKWKQVHAEYKANKAKAAQQSASKPLPQTDSRPSTTASAAASSVKVGLSIPYIPKGRIDMSDDMRRMMIEKFIGKLQMPLKDTDPAYEKETLEKAIDVAVDLERAIFDINKGSEKPRKDKFRSLMQVLGQQAHMRSKLLSGRVTAMQMVQMKRDDFLSAELKRQKSEAEEAAMQASRTDWARAQD